MQREFVDPASRQGRWKHYSFSQDGIYEEVGYSGKGNKHERFIRLEAGEATELTKDEVLALFNAPEKGQAPKKRPDRCPECDMWLPEHEITCALIDAEWLNDDEEKTEKKSMDPSEATVSSVLPDDATPIERAKAKAYETLAQVPTGTVKEDYLPFVAAMCAYLELQQNEALDADNTAVSFSIAAQQFEFWKDYERLTGKKFNSTEVASEQAGNN